MAFLRTLLLAAFFILLVPHAWATPSCNDLEIDPSHITVSENREDRSISFTLTNEDSHAYEIQDVRIQESNPHFDIDVDDFPDQIDGDDDGRIQLRYTTFDVNGDTDASFSLQVRGEFDNSTVDCSFSQASFTIDITIEDGDDVCALVEASASDVSVLENETLTHTIRVENHTSQDFTIQGFSIFEDSSAFTVNADPPFSDADFERTIPANGSQTYTVEIDARATGEDVTDTVFVEIRGEFEDGVDCSSTEISAEFDVTVEDTGTNATVCSDIAINAPPVTIVGGETSMHAFTLLNHSAQTFYVDEYAITDLNYQVSFDPLFTPENIPFQTSEELTYNTTGYPNAQSFDSNATLALKGHFTSGSTCFISAKKLPFHFVGTNGGTCNQFYAGINPVSVLKGTQTMDVLFHNPLNGTATVRLTMDAGTVAPSTITLSGGQVELVTLHFTGAAQNTVLRVNAAVPGCTIAPQQSQVFFSGLDNAPVQFLNPPRILTIGSANEFAIQLQNQSAFEQDVTITVIAKPGNATLVRETKIPGLDEPLLFLPAAILKGKSAAVIQVKSAGYIVTHTIQLENAQGVSVVPSVSDQPNGNNEYNVNVVVENHTPQTAEGNVIVDAPKGWEVHGNAYTQLGAYQKTVVSFTVKPSTLLNEDRSIMVRFDSPKNKSAPAPAFFRASQNPFTNATALVTGSNGMWLGLIIVVVLLGLWYAAKPKPSAQAAGKMERAFSARAGFINQEDAEWPDEVWMNPPKP